MEQRSGRNPASDREMLEWMKRMMDCYYWAASAKDAPTDDVTLLDELGGCLETMAAALSLVTEPTRWASHQSESRREGASFDRGAPSALRAAFPCPGVTAEPEQLEVFEWIKTDDRALPRLRQAIHASRRCRGGGPLARAAGPH